MRHGRTAWNAALRFQGRTDVPLDSQGFAQAQALAAFLRRERFDIALSSDLSRAVATAAPIGAACHIAVEPEPRLREMSFGSWEGRTWQEIVAETPALADASRTAPAEYTPAGGETFDEVTERVRPVLAEVTARLTQAGRALIVSHAGIMHALLRAALGDKAQASLEISLLPASIMRLSGDGSLPWRLERFNEIVPPLADSVAAVT